VVEAFMTELFFTMPPKAKGQTFIIDAAVVKGEKDLWKTAKHKAA
jgi:hypothetical protein